MNEPQSELTLHRPDLWNKALTLATGLTGYIYAPKMPAEDGTIWACGGGYYVPSKLPIIPPKPKTPDEIRDEKIKEIEADISNKRSRVEILKEDIREREEEIQDLEREISKLEKQISNLKSGLQASPVVYVPEGAMEWLLHEVGHYIAATPEERMLPDYGYGTIKKKGWGKARELQAWGFEEIILSPFGNPRLIAPPEHRGGTAFENAGPLSEIYTNHAYQQMKTLGIDAEQWRVLYGQWIEWENSRKKN